ncbi:MAG: PAS domain-containing protein [Gammaproteobacteria bacterium]
MRRKDGSEVPVDICLGPLQTENGLIVSAAIRDNSARQQAEQALRESEARLKFAQEASGVASWEWNMKSGDTTCSDNYPVLYGREAGDGPFNYQDWADTLHPDDRKQVLQAFTQAIKHPQQRFFQEYRVLWPDGSVHWIATRGGVVCDAQGQPAKMVGTDTEITGRKQAEQDRIRLEAQLFLAQKMQAIGQLTGGIAHDFNNILTGILGYCRLALRRCVDDDEGKLARYLREIQHGGERARDMIARMLAFSRTGPGDAGPQSLPTLVESALGLLRPSLPASIDLHTHIADDLPPVRTDAGQFEQVLMNLCINARDAMDGNGGITIELYLSRLHWKECHSCHAVVSGEFVVLSVQDSGSGIPAEMQASIFDPFFSTKEVGQGTGLGLSMVHGIMHECGGHIRIHSTAAKGTTFYLLFPTGQGDAVQGPAAAAMEGPVLDDGRKQGVIMVIDDEVPVANYMRELLQEHGYGVVVQTDSSAALSIIQQAPDDVDLVITDQTMPGITGLELAREILLLRADMPVILTTGYSKQVVDETITKEAGIRAYIMKPIDDTALLDKVDGILAPQSRQDE